MHEIKQKINYSNSFESFAKNCRIINTFTSFKKLLPKDRYNTIIHTYNMKKKEKIKSLLIVYYRVGGIEGRQARLVV